MPPELPQCYSVVQKSQSGAIEPVKRASLVVFFTGSEAAEIPLLLLMSDVHNVQSVSVRQCYLNAASSAMLLSRTLSTTISRSADLVILTSYHLNRPDSDAIDCARTVHVRVCVALMAKMARASHSADVPE